MEQLPPTIFIAVGTIVAALISALIALFSLVMSKEIKVSELRQEWINDLRKELSKLISLVNKLGMVWYLTENKNEETRKKILRENIKDIQEIDELTHCLRMRLNPNEHQVLVKYILELEKFASNVYLFENKRELEDLYDNYTIESNKVLKSEWARVKNGEVSYRRMIKGSKFVAIISIVSLVISIQVI